MLRSRVSEVTRINTHVVNAGAKSKDPINCLTVPRSSGGNSIVDTVLSKSINLLEVLCLSVFPKSE